MFDELLAHPAIVAVKKWFEQEKERGLVDVKFTADIYLHLLPYEEALSVVFEEQIFSREEVLKRRQKRIVDFCKEILEINKAIEQGVYTEWVEPELAQYGLENPPPNKKE